MKKITSICLVLMMLISLVAVGGVTVSATESSATILPSIFVSQNQIEPYRSSPYYSTESDNTSLFEGWYSFLDGVYLSSFQRDISGCSESEMKNKALQYIRIDDRTTDYKIFAYLVESDDDSLPSFTEYKYNSGNWIEVDGVWYDAYIWSDADTIYFPENSSHFFDTCSCLDMNLHGFDFSKVEDASFMFSCLNDSLLRMGDEPIYVDVLDLSPMNLSNCESFCYFLAQYDERSSCAIAKHIILPVCDGHAINQENWDWGQLIGGDGAEAIETIDCSRFKVPSGYQWNIGSLPSVESIDVSHWDLNNMTNVSFSYWENLKTVYVAPDTDISENKFDSYYKEYVFDGASSLIGGNGTVYSGAHTDWSYARVDGKDGLPGYFTAKLPEEPVDETKILASGNNGKSIVTLDYDTANLRVTVPTVLPVSIDSDNNVTVSDNAKIVNNSKGQVDVTNAVLSGNNSWTLAAFDTDFTKVPVDTKQYGFKLQGYSVPVSGNAFNNQFDTIAGNASLDLNYDANVAIQSEAISAAEIGNIVFTVAWHK